MAIDKTAFLEWLEEDVEGAYVNPERVEDEFPGVHKEYPLTGITMQMDDDGNTLVAVSDYRNAVSRGGVLD